ncbi:MAG: DEAD/DEAH box helicase [Opitutaceae bacterium]|jgi:hypothetical protein|nr:DEAD/DEAH box helicase [Opitutaceae bacterium]
MPKLRFKQFQKEDLARAACRNGAILAWDPGLGKGLAAFAWPLIKQARRTLIVAPEGLHLQLRDTGREFFGIHVLGLKNQNEFFQWRLDREPVVKRPLFFLTSYTDLWLVGNGPGRMQTALAQLAQRHGSFDCVVVDEGTRLQSNDAHVANAVRLLSPRYRLVLTGTPIKNRLESLFWLAWWAAGGSQVPTLRWSYAGIPGERERFANEHLLRDKFLTREKNHFAETGQHRNITRRSARITNVHHLWKVLAPVVIRRRKCDCGEDIVPRVIKPVVVPLGKRQSAVYRYHLLHQPRVANSGDAIVRINNLRMAALCPYSENLGRVRTDTDFTPKTDAIMQIVAECLERGEQVVVGSSFVSFGNSLHLRLQEAGIASALLDGSVSANERAEMSRDFKFRRYSVVVAGIKAMGEGNSWECCNNLIFPSLDWALDINEQFVNRVWRLNSPRGISIYTITTAGTIDEQLSELFREKSESSQLALDGCLQENVIEEVILERLLRNALKCGKITPTKTIDETLLIDNWMKLRTRLANAQNMFWQFAQAA